MPTHTYSALVGNGLSIPYNANLAVPALTTALVDDLTALSGTEAGNALATFARAVRGGRATLSDFERLLGPLEAAVAALPHLSLLADLVSNSAAVRPAVQLTQEFAQSVHTLGMATVLGRIARESEARLSDVSFVSTVRRWVDAFHALPAAHEKTIGTLNYDGLVHAAGLSLNLELADLATGYIEKDHVVVSAKPHLRGVQLRDSDNLVGSGLHVLNLHGSLNWLASSSGEVWKFELGDLRDQGFWKALSTGNTSWRPVVILTDQKDRAVALEPFSLAYESFRQRLVRSDRWMIVGYGFGDGPVNAVLRSAASAMADRVRADLKILCIDHEKTATRLTRKVAETARVDRAQILVDVSGIPAAIGGASWQRWSE